MTKRTMDFILILIGITTLIFTIVMIWVYLITGAIPDTLCTCFFAACTGECGIMGIIRSVKEKYREREWQLEDLARQAEELEKLQKQLNNK